MASPLPDLASTAPISPSAPRQVETRSTSDGALLASSSFSLPRASSAPNQMSQHTVARVNEAPSTEQSSQNDRSTMQAAPSAQYTDPERKRLSDGPVPGDDQHRNKRKRIVLNLPRMQHKVDRSSFAFQESITDDSLRLNTKDHARETGMKHLRAMQEILLRNPPEGEEEANDAKDFVDGVDKLIVKDRGHEILVGVCGGTGVGKTSLLNACLGFDELLPSSQEEAATAVPCKISYNYDERPGHQSLAQVCFRSMDAVTEDLRLLLQAFVNRHEAQLEGRRGDCEEYDAEITRGVQRYAPVWKFEEGELEARIMGTKVEGSKVAHISSTPMTGEQVPVNFIEIGEEDVKPVIHYREEETLAWILGLNPAVTQLLSRGTRMLRASSPEALAEDIKPYLDSTESDHGCEGGIRFAAWPLVSGVRLFLKCDMLRNGICLVDLPGVGDHNESRNNVSKKYQSQLTLTIIVGSILRAKDTKDTNSLLNAKLQTSMELDGTLNKDHFAVVLTKADDMVPERYRFREPANRDQYHALGAQSERARTQASELTSSVRLLDKAINKAEKKIAKRSALQMSTSSSEGQVIPAGDASIAIHNASADAVAQDENPVLTRAATVRKSLIDRRGAAEVRRKLCKQSRVHLAIVARNKYVRQCMKESLSRRQRLYARSLEDKSAVGKVCNTDQIGRVFATSARGYWSIVKDKTHLPGLPTEQFTGVPELQQWIKRSAALHRESHVDDIISDMHVLLERLRAWSRPKCVSSTIDDEALQQELERRLEVVHTLQIDSIDRGIKQACEIIHRLDPFGERQYLRKQFIEQAPGIVSRWTKKFPDDPGNSKKMASSTHRAIISRDGTFKSPTTEQSYDWMGRLSQPIMEGLAISWRSSIDRSANEIANVFARIRSEWTPYGSAILQEVTKLDPVRALDLADLDQTVLPSGDSLERDMRSTLEDLKENASRMHYSTVSPSLQDFFDPFFKEARGITGNKSVALRHELLLKAIGEHVLKIFQQIWLALRTSLNKHKAEARKELNQLSKKAVEEVKTALSCRLHTKRRRLSGDTASEARGIVHSWSTEWRFPRLDPTHVFQQELGVPDTITVNDLGVDHPLMAYDDVSYFDLVSQGEQKQGEEAGDDDDEMDDIVTDLAMV